MTEKRTFEPEGRRNGDAMLGRLVKIIAIAGAIATGFAFVNHTLGEVSASTVIGKLHTAQIDSLKSDAKDTHTAIGAVAYMSCVNFSATHKPAEVPAYCNGATRENSP